MAMNLLFLISLSNVARSAMVVKAPPLPELEVVAAEEAMTLRVIRRRLGVKRWRRRRWDPHPRRQKGMVFVAAAATAGMAE